MREHMTRLRQLFVLSCFFPYPALANVGTTIGIQASQILALMIVLLAPQQVLRAKSAKAFAVFAFCLILSAFAAYVVNPELATGQPARSALALLLGMIVLLASGPLFKGSDTRWLVAPVSIALISHAAAGVGSTSSFKTAGSRFYGFFTMLVSWTCLRSPSPMQNT